MASEPSGFSHSQGPRRRSEHVRDMSAYPPIAAGEQTSRLVGSVPHPDIDRAVPPSRGGSPGAMLRRRSASRRPRSPQDPRILNPEAAAAAGCLRRPERCLGKARFLQRSGRRLYPSNTRQPKSRVTQSQLVMSASSPVPPARPSRPRLRTSKSCVAPGIR